MNEICDSCGCEEFVYSEEFDPDAQTFIEISICVECGERQGGAILE